jgi:hypothetical protein
MWRWRCGGVDVEMEMGMWRWRCGGGDVEIEMWRCVDGHVHVEMDDEEMDDEMPASWLADGEGGGGGTQQNAKVNLKNK